MLYLKYSLILLIASTLPVYAAEIVTPPGDGQLTLIVYESKTESEFSDGGSGSSRTQNAILERNIGKSSEGLELEYFYLQPDIPENEAWKLPARVLTIPGISTKLLNEPEIATRLNEYLNKYPDIREKCGEAVFTWAAFQINCGTNHVIDIIKSYNLHLGELYEGKDYVEAGAIASVPLKQKPLSNSNFIYKAKLILDPKYIQAEHEQSMQQVAEIMGKSLDAMMKSSLRLTGDETPGFSGTRIVTIEVASGGAVVKLQRETTIKIKGGKEFEETRTQNETLTRQSVE